MTLDRKQTRDTAWHNARIHSTRKGAKKRQVIQLNIQDRILYTTAFDWHKKLFLTKQDPPEKELLKNACNCET